MTEAAAKPTGTRRNHPLGSAAGAEMLALGGNAIDAAIAAVFALSVVEPAMVGPFGAGFINVRLANGEHHVIDNYSKAPAAASPDMYRPVSDTWPSASVTWRAYRTARFGMSVR